MNLSQLLSHDVLFYYFSCKISTEDACEDSPVQISKSLLRILNGSINVECAHVRLVGAAGHILQLHNVAQPVKLVFWKHILRDFQRFELFPPFKRGDELFSSGRDGIFVCAEEFLEDDQSGERCSCLSVCSSLVSRTVVYVSSCLIVSYFV